MKKHLIAWLLVICMTVPFCATAEDLPDPAAEVEVEVEEVSGENADETGINAVYIEIPDAEAIEEPEDVDIPPETEIADADFEEDSDADISNMELLIAEFSLSPEEICQILGKSEDEINAMPAEKLEYAKDIIKGKMNPVANDSSIVSSGTCGSNLTWVLDSDGLLAISGTGAMTEFEAASPYSTDCPWFANRTAITSVKISNGVTSIGSFAFYKCSNLSSIDIAESVKSIGSAAFRDCTALKQISLPDGLTTFGNGVFALSGITSIEIPKGVTAITNSLFYESSLETCTLPDGITSIGSDAFAECKLKTIAIPDSVQTIGSYAFSLCSNLESEIIIPEGVESIKNSTFLGCNHLKSVKLPCSLISIEESAFFGCSSLSDFELPEGIRTIGKQALAYVPVSSLSLSSAVTSIGKYAFQYTSLNDVYYIGSEDAWNTLTEGMDVFNGGATPTMHFNTHTSHTPAEAVRENVIDSTCAVAGSYEAVVYCSVCNVELSRTTQSIEKKAHTPIVDAAVDATCTLTGLTEGKHCSVCSAVIVAQKTVPAKGHTAVIDSAVEATCTKNGLTEGKHCSVCSAVIVAQKTVPAKGHTVVPVAGKAATCTESGLTDGTKCSVCSTILTEQTVIPAKGHSNVTIPGKAATCTEPGLTYGMKCVDCGEITVGQTEIPAFGHTAVKIPGKQSTCTETGLTEGERCITCGTITIAQKTIPTIEHTGTTIPGKDATCTETGLTEGTKCSVCGTILKAQQIIPAKGHVVETVEEIPPTSVTSGRSEYTICSVCREVLTEEAVLPALGVYPDTLKLGRGETYTPMIIGDESKVYSTSSNKIAAVSAEGAIKGIKYGKANVTVTAENGYSQTVQVTIGKAASKVTLSKTTASLTVNDTLQLTAKLKGYSNTLIWSSSNTEVATVENGMITAVGKGKATITVKTFNNKKAKCTVTVYDIPTGITLTKTTAELVKGKTLTLKATVVPAGAKQTFTWKSSNTAVATVSSSGKITAKGVGQCIIAATTVNGITVECMLKVTAVPTKVMLSATKATMSVGENLELTAAVVPETASQFVTWSSSSKKIATVDANGMVTAVKKGNVTITAKTPTGKTAKCTITVK